MIAYRDKKTGIIIICLFFSFFLHGQESNVKFNSEGKYFSRLKHTWQAKWITHPTESTLDYGVFLFRRTFTLTDKPEKYIIYVSADNRYKLYVNGELVSRGPARGDLLNWRYETIDISDYLVKGKNIIAAEVVNFGEYRHAAQHTFQTAFILQSDSTNNVIINTGENGWKVTKNKGFKYIPFTSDSLGAYFCAGPGDHIIGSKYPWGWQNIDHDDNNWQTPRSASVESAVGRNFLYGSTWFLVPRNIPFLEEKEVRFSNIVRNTGIKIKNEFLEGNSPATIPPKTKASILIDQKWLTIGYPKLAISGGKESKIKITYAESLFKKHDLGTHGASSHENPALIKGNRNNIENKEIFGYYDIIEPDGGDNRLYTTLWWRTYRYVQLDIETSNEALILNDFYGLFSAYPLEEKASFKSDNLLLEKIWEVAWRTQRLNSVETFSDCPYYEQLQYIGDTRIQALNTLYVSGDDRLMRNAIEQFDNSRIPEGLTLSRYPSYISQVIPPYSLFWIAMIYDYHMYRDDSEFIKKFIPGITQVINWFERKLDDNMLLGNLEWWNFTDWSDGYTNGVPLGAEFGYSTTISLQFVYALQKASVLMKYAGKEELAEKYDNLSTKIIGSVKNQCFDSSKGMFSETPEKKVFSQHTNILAILTDTVEKQHSKALMKKILEEDGLIKSTIYFKFYLFRALQEAEMGDEYINELTPWITMLNQGLTTFAETDNNPRSDCHAWSASPCFDFLHTITGIYPGEPGFKSIIIKPSMGALKKIDAKMPHPNGEIGVTLTKNENNGVSGTIILPENIQGKFIWKEKSIELKSGENTLSIN